MAETTALLERTVKSAGGEGEVSAGEVTDEGKTKSSIFIGSDGGVPAWSMDSRSCAMPDGAAAVCWCNLGRMGRVPVSHGLSLHARPGPPGCAAGWTGVGVLPCLFLPLLLQTHGHQPPGHVFHPLMIGDLGFDLADDFPHMRAEGIVLLHLIGVVPIGSGRVVMQVGKEGFTQQLPAGLALALVEGEIQFASGVTVRRARDR